jgi:hypothetical protein
MIVRTASSLFVEVFGAAPGCVYTLMVTGGSAFDHMNAGDSSRGIF